MPHSPGFATFVPKAASSTVRARDLITDWIDANPSWKLPDWRPDLMGERLAIIAMNYGWYGDSADETFQSRLAHSVEMQLRCLAMDWRRMRSVDKQIGALRGIALAEAALGGEDSRIEALQDMLFPKIRSVTHDDGGHVSRMPDRHITLMRQLVEFRMATSLAAVDGSGLSDTVKRMGAVARMWRHGDGRIAHFNGGGGTSAEIAEETLLRAGVHGKAVQQAPYSGFLRMGSGRTVVIMDAGDMARDDIIAGSGTLGFEMSVGPTQLVVNSGQMMKDDASPGHVLDGGAFHPRPRQPEFIQPARRRFASISGSRSARRPAGCWR